MAGLPEVDHRVGGSVPTRWEKFENGLDYVGKYNFPIPLGTATGALRALVATVVGVVSIATHFIVSHTGKDSQAKNERIAFWAAKKASCWKHMKIGLLEIIPGVKWFAMDGLGYDHTSNPGQTRLTRYANQAYQNILAALARLDAAKSRQSLGQGEYPPAEVQPGLPQAEGRGPGSTRLARSAPIDDPEASPSSRKEGGWRAHRPPRLDLRGIVGSAVAMPSPLSPPPSPQGGPGGVPGGDVGGAPRSAASSPFSPPLSPPPSPPPASPGGVPGGGEGGDVAIPRLIHLTRTRPVPGGRLPPTRDRRAQSGAQHAELPRTTELQPRRRRPPPIFRGPVARRPGEFVSGAQSFDDATFEAASRVRLPDSDDEREAESLAQRRDSGQGPFERAAAGRGPLSALARGGIAAAAALRGFRNRRRDASSSAASDGPV